MTEPNLYICALLIAAGIAFHFLLKLQELERQGQIITPWAYWAKNPYTSLSVVFGAYLFMAMAFYMQQLTYLAAITIGVACNSLGDKLRANANTALDKIRP